MAGDIFLGPSKKNSLVLCVLNTVQGRLYTRFLDILTYKRTFQRMTNRFYSTAFLGWNTFLNPYPSKKLKLTAFS